MLFHSKLQIILKEIFYLVVEYLQLKKVKIEENDKNSIIVHEEFAKQNNLKLGDEVDLELLDIEKSGKIKSHKFKIIGIFSGKNRKHIQDYLLILVKIWCL